MVTSLFAGLTVGSVYALIAIGYNMTLITTGVLNFAFANVMMLGAFAAISGLSLGLPLPLVLLLAALTGAVVSLLKERLAIRFLPRNGHAELITTVGVAMMLTGATAVIWGSEAQRISLFPQEPLEVLGGLVLPSALIVIAATVALGIGLHIYNARTKFGLASLAHAADREASMLRGVNVRWMSLVAFVAAGTVGAVLGPLVAMTTTASAFIAFSLALKGFIVLTAGGLGSYYGALIAGVIIGLLESLTSLTVGVNYGEIAVFLVFLAVLLVRPQGLFGKKVRRFV